MIKLFPLPNDEHSGKNDMRGKISDDDIINISEEEIQHADDDIMNALAFLEQAEITTGADFEESETEDEFDVTPELDRSDKGVSIELPAPDEKLKKMQLLQEAEAIASVRLKEAESLSRQKLKEAEASVAKLQQKLRQLGESHKKAQSTIDELNKKVEEIHGSWVRVNADYQNYRRRTRLKMDEFVEHEKFNIIRGFLPIVDNFKRAMLLLADETQIAQPIPSGTEPELTNGATMKTPRFNDGIRMIFKQVEAMLNEWGVSEIPAKGERFDPYVHEAIDRYQVPAEKSNRIIDVYETGYLIKKKVLRPSKVIVGYSPESISARSDAAGPVIQDQESNEEAKDTGKSVSNRVSSPPSEDEASEAIRDILDLDSQDQISKNEI